MAERYGTIEVRMEREKLKLVGMGKTGRGQRYIKKTVPIDAKDPRSPDFKKELAKAVTELFASGA